MNGYEAKIEYCSKELSARERVAAKDTTNAIQLDTETKNCELIFDVDYIVVLSIHNERSKGSKDYKKLVVVDKAGSKYVTGSESFRTSLFEIVDEMQGTGEAYQISAYKKPSKNFNGKGFLTCSIV